MKLIFLYGPPSVGKMTIATILSKKTGFGIFHNHLTIDLAKLIYPFKSKKYFEYCNRLRMQIIEKAIQEKINGLILTFVYPFEGNEKFIRELKNTVGFANGETFFVKLYCENRELYKRLVNPTRKKFSKLTSVKRLKELFSTYDLNSFILGVHSGVVNTTYQSPAKSARQILEYIGGK